MNKIFTPENVNTLKINSKVPSYIEIEKSNTDTIMIECETDYETLLVKGKEKEGVFNLKISDPISSIKSIIPVNLILDTLSVIAGEDEDNQSVKSLKKNDARVRITISIPESLSNIKLKIDSSKLKINSVTVGELKIKAKDSRIVLSDDCSVFYGNLNLTNCRLKFPLQSPDQKLDVVVENSKLKLGKINDFALAKNITGLGMEVKGAEGENDINANISIDGTNSVIKFLEPIINEEDKNSKENLYV